MQGRIAIFDGCKPLKMEESENRTFPIPSRESPRKGFYEILMREKHMNNIRTVKAMFLAGMIATAAPMAAVAGEAPQNLQQEIVEQGEEALKAMSIRLVHDMDWSRQVSRQLAEQNFTPETGTLTEFPQRTVPMEQHADRADNPPITVGDFRTAGTTNP